MDDLVAALKADPGAVSWAGGSAGGTDHILAGLIAKAAGVDPTKVNYIAFSGGGEALAAILGGQVTVGVSGYGEFAEPGRGRRAAACSRSRARSGSTGVDAPTLKEAGRRRGAGELAHGRRGAGHHRRAEGGDHRRHREDGEVGGLAEGAGRPAAGSTRYLAGDAFDAQLDADIDATAAILKDIGLVQ